MNINELSDVFTVKYLTEQDIPKIMELCKGNPQYYEHCPPDVSEESIRKDMTALPPRKTKDDKHYFGFFEGDSLVAVMDLIEKYPNENTAFIGFFMMNKEYQGKGVGSRIIGSVRCAEKIFQIYKTWLCQHKYAGEKLLAEKWI